jgi:hypothetical protein
MRCGKCGRTGDVITVDQVKACYAGDTGVHPMEVGNTNDGPMVRPSQPQVDYLLALQESKVLPADYVVRSAADLYKQERADVSAWISALRNAQNKTANSNAKQREWMMPPGRYALYSPGPDDTPGAYSYVDRQDLNPPVHGKWVFYQVDKPLAGRWAGYTFIKRLVGAPGSYQKYPVEPASTRNALLEAIEKDPKKAMVDFGIQSGTCGRCNSPLTDPKSLELGIGPKCRTKDGWF